MRATLDKLVTAKGYPEAIRALGYDPHAGGARAGRRSRERQHLQARPLRLPGARAPRPHDDRSRDGRRAVPARADAPVGAPLRLDRFAVRAARGGAVRRCWSTTSIARIRRGKPSYTTCGRTSASASTSRTATDRSRRSSARELRRVHRARRGAGRDAAQVPLVGEAPLPAHQLGVGLHEPRHELPARRRARPAYPSVAQLLRHHRRQRRQAGVLHRRAAVHRARRRRANPLLEEPPDGPFQRGRIYSGGNIKDFQERARASGDRVLFVGDHIYGDMLRSRKSSNWRTAMVLQELEHEVATYDRLRADAGAARPARRRAHPPRLRAQRAASRRCARCRSWATRRPASDQVAGARSARSRTRSRRCARRCARRPRSTARSRARSTTRFNPYWGPLFREGYEVSKFGEQVEAYACVYTSRVSNFRFYSPMQYFRGPRDRMPHER